jgi:hypothetical protein
VGAELLIVCRTPRRIIGHGRPVFGPVSDTAIWNAELSLYRTAGTIAAPPVAAAR